jgi:hypothetical protein
LGETPQGFESLILRSPELQKCGTAGFHWGKDVPLVSVAVSIADALRSSHPRQTHAGSKRFQPDLAGQAGVSVL